VICCFEYGIESSGSVGGGEFLGNDWFVKEGSATLRKLMRSVNLLKFERVLIEYLKNCFHSQICCVVFRL
jgi:hypothetical protein